jgi:hypothetical protein
MPALSQTLNFVPLNTPSSTSTTAVVYPNSGTEAIVFISDKVKGDGYFGGSDGLHTVMYTATQDFSGTITMQATLATVPTNSDWFNVSNSSVAYTELNVRNTSTVDIINFTGNFVWVRGHVYINDGSVESILYNH